jgi:hypothetical protein
MTDKTKTIRELNDKFRKGDNSIPGQIMITRGITDLLEEINKTPDDLLHTVRTYDNFTPDNDPHKEHDFGSLEFVGYTCFWKFDYYDLTLKWGSEDASDISITKRVLTVMLAEEY